MGCASVARLEVCVLLSLRDLECGEIRFDESFPAASVDLQGTSFRACAAYRMVGVARLSSASGEIHLSGEITAQLERECDRCLDVAQLPIEEHFDLDYRPLAIPAEPEKEVTVEDTEVGYYSGAGLELAEVLQEQVLLTLPMHWTCSGDCQGFCPVCGANRNRERCACSEQPVNDRWAALGRLKTARS